MKGSTVVVARYPYRHQAELVAGYLRDAGIRVAVFTDDGGGSEVALGFINTARVVVRADEEERALELIRDLNVEPDPGEDVAPGRVEDVETG